MKKITTYFFYAIILVCAASCGTASKTLSSQSAVNTGFVCTNLMGDGSLIVRCTAYGASREAAMENALGGVVEAMIFSGISGDSQSRISFQAPLVNKTGEREANRTYFDQFFSQKKYRQFASAMPSSPPTFIKSGGGYKVTADLIVRKNTLRRELESNNVIKSLKNVF